MILIKDNAINSIYLVINGNIKIYDDELKLVNQYKKNEISGIEYLKIFCNKKYKMNLEDIFESFNNDKSSSLNKKTFKKMIISHLAMATLNDGMHTNSVASSSKKDTDDAKI